MSYQNLDREIAHLEVVFGRLSVNDSLPLSYWDSRLRALSGAPLMPAQRARVARLAATLAALREPEEAVCDVPPPRWKEAR
ncbi:hypothetical protein [Burkholderia sp. WSM2232]|uniref:hypothetical protein n=1 Tax=Burkholderia sp. WSM2232 TaxID=944436 RepID=UPI0004171268|nr:hypothetical protein [Burkholderia sp. WSM2232]